MLIDSSNRRTCNDVIENNGKSIDFSDYSHVAITTTRVIATNIIRKLQETGFRGEILDFDCHTLG